MTTSRRRQNGPRTAAGLEAGALLAADPLAGVGRAPPRVSFEFFPPKTEEMEEKLWQTVKRVEPLGPRFVSVTYGAGGSTRARTHATVLRIRIDTALEPAAHLTCVGAPQDAIDAVARLYWDSGIRHVVALRGDPPAGEGPYTP
ncbi:MAG: methylenetetrahydrofolate reductase, partial [Alphaproteobacteria bacterium]|nr:methylenetetrahydrofolate reductase [Alphaproteobacteria bacterium]